MVAKGSIYFLAHEIIGYWLIWELIAKVMSHIRSDCVDWSSSLILFPHTQGDHTFSCHINKNKRPLMTFIDLQRCDSSLAPTTVTVVSPQLASDSGLVFSFHFSGSSLPWAGKLGHWNPLLLQGGAGFHCLLILWHCHLTMVKLRNHKINEIAKEVF